LQWDGGYEGESLKKIIKSLEKAKTVMLDRWQLEVEPENENLTKESEKPPSLIINNYFSIGVDASIARRFHLLREKSPEKFNSRVRNKLHYVELFTSEVLWSTCRNLHEAVTLVCDGDAIDLLKGKVLEGIAMLNIDSIYGGVDIWKGRRIAIARHLNQLVHRHPTSHQLGDRVQDISDGLFEVVGLQSAMHMGQIRIGIRTNARRLAQCSTLVIQTNKELPMQIDGEPWMQQPCTIRIAHKNKVPMLEGKIKRCKWYLPKCCTVGD